MNAGIQAIFADITAKVADNRFFMTLTAQSVRQMLKSKVWDSGGTKVLVVNHFRDLGSHVCMDDSRTAVTITQRIVKATAMVKKLKRLRTSKMRKAKSIRTNALPAGLYGTDTWHISSKAMQDFRSAIVSTLGSNSCRRSPTMVLEVGSYGRTQIQRCSSWSAKWPF